MQAKIEITLLKQEKLRLQTNVEARKPGIRFVRPSLEKLEEPTTDIDVTEMEISSTFVGKASSSIKNEVIGDFSIRPPRPTAARKCLSTSEPEILQGSMAQDEINIDVPPPYKRTKESEFSKNPEANDTPLSSENPDTTPIQAMQPPSKASEMQILQTKDELDVNTVKEAEDNFLVNDQNPKKEDSFDQATFGSEQSPEISTGILKESPVPW